MTGPTGSGKTTTLYSCLNSVNDVATKIITTEDPVEYELEGVVQIQVNEEIGVTYANCLRSILRQDPDVILVGEIRDLETAQIAVEASLTGHLVFSTLHTNDAPLAVTRLLDLGVEPFLVAATVEAILAQRLVRKICSGCKVTYEPVRRRARRAGAEAPRGGLGNRFAYGRGCTRLQRHRLQGPHGDLRDHAHVGDAAPDGDRQRLVRRAARAGASRGHADAARVRASSRSSTA